MSLTAALAAAFVCPRCRGELVAADGELSCGCCGGFPIVATAPCLFEDAAAAIADWRGAAHAFAAQLQRNLAAIDQQSSEDRQQLTHARLRRLRDGLTANAERLLALLEEAGIAPQPVGVDESPPRASVMECYVQTLRDWAWDGGEHRENARALELVSEASSDEPLGKLLVVGAGACRLAFDVHQRCAPEMTVALDVNPLPFIVASKVMSGDALSLYEFPSTPRDAASACVEHVLHARSETTDRFAFVFADALSLPGKAAAFDTVLTPWFIDQVPRDLAAFVPVLKWALREGGRWLSYGPLVYQPTIPLANRYTLAEVRALADSEGFALSEPIVSREPYLCSPASAQGRLEEVVAFCATRNAGDAQPPPRAWLSRVDAPIPRFVGLVDYQAPNPVFAEVARRIDGRTSAAQIAEHLVRSYNIPRQGAADGVRITVEQIYRSCER